MNRLRGVETPRPLGGELDASAASPPEAEGALVLVEVSMRIELRAETLLPPAAGKGIVRPDNELVVPCTERRESR